jgi:hypothetical protein
MAENTKDQGEKQDQEVKKQKGKCGCGCVPQVKK